MNVDKYKLKKLRLLQFRVIANVVGTIVHIGIGILLLILFMQGRI